MKRLENPSKYQQDIFDFLAQGTGHGVIKATAGSGKTTTLVEAAYRLPRGTHACFVAFNTHAAEQLKTRLPKSTQARTIHALGLMTLRSGLGKAQHEIRVVKDKSLSLAEHVLKNDPRTWRLPPEEMRAAVRYTSELVRYIRLELATPKMIPELVKRYNLQLSDRQLTLFLHELVWLVLERGLEQALAGLVDFEDMVFVPVLKEMKPPQPFDFVMVDEAQDLSKAQLAFVQQTVKPSGRLLFVGDAYQTIYGFSGADPDAIGRIVRWTQATVLPLSTTYRCPKSHVRLARTFSPDITAAPGTAEGSVNIIGEASLATYIRAEDLVLCRLNAPLVKTALGLIRQGVPARVVGRDIEGKLIGDAKAALSSSPTNWPGQLERYEVRVLGGIERRTLARDTKDRLLAQREDELTSLRSVLDFAVIDGVETLEDLLGHIRHLFREAHAATFSTVHKAKGKEAERVFILYPHLMPLPFVTTTEAQQGEACVQFVALTRSLSELTFVESKTEASVQGWWRLGYEVPTSLGKAHKHIQGNPK